MSTPTVSARSGLDYQDLRMLVRQVLHESLPELASGVGGGTRDGDLEPVQAVPVTNDADLNAFARMVAELCEDPVRRERLRNGHGRFRLVSMPAGDGPGPALPPAVHQAPPVHRVERGALTERHVRDAAAAGASLHAARGVAVTPLARDRAKAMGVHIERER